MENGMHGYLQHGSYIIHVLTGLWQAGHIGTIPENLFRL